MLDTNLRTIMADLLQEIPDCISIFLQESASGKIIARAIQAGNISTQTPENQFYQLMKQAREALKANGEEKINEIVITGEKQINLILMLQEGKYLLWLSTGTSTKLGIVRYKLTKFITAIEKVL